MAAGGGDEAQGRVSAAGLWLGCQMGAELRGWRGGWLCCDAPRTPRQTVTRREDFWEIGFVPICVTYAELEKPGKCFVGEVFLCASEK